MENYVVEALESVRRQRADVEDYECIVVNDGSSDRSGELVDEYIASLEGNPHPHFTLINWANRGVAQARNMAISVAKGEWILPLDADDTLDPAAIFLLKRYISIEPETTLFIPNRIMCSRNGKTQFQERVWGGYEDLKERCTPTNTSCFKKADWERVGGYRDGTMYEDWEFWIRLLYKNDRVVSIPHPLYNYRIRADSRWHEAVKLHWKEVMLIRKMNPEIFSG